MKKKITLIAPVIVMIIVTIMSAFSITNLLYKNKAQLEGMINLKNHFEELINVDISLSVVQNLMHIPVFALLSFLWMIYLCVGMQVKFNKAVLLAVTFTLLFGIIDEIHQFFVVGRDASLMDLSLNLLGALIGIRIFKMKDMRCQMVNSESKG